MRRPVILSLSNGTLLGGRLPVLPPSIDQRAATRQATTGRPPASMLAPPVHPSEILKKQFLEPLELGQHRLAKGINVPPRRTNEIVHGTRAISADTPLQLARYFGTSEEFWLNLQMHYDLEVERDRLRPRLRKEVSLLERAS